MLHQIDYDLVLLSKLVTSNPDIEIEIRIGQLKSLENLIG